MILHAKVFYYKRLQPFERRRIITLLQGELHCMCQLPFI